MDLGSNELEYDAPNETYRVRYSNTSMAPSLALVDAISRIEGVDPVDLEPLNTVFDPDALDSILQWEKEGDRSIGFAYEGYDVLAKSYGVIELTERD